MSRRQSLRIVPTRFDDEASGGGEATRARAQDEAAVDKRPPGTRKSSEMSEDDEILDDLDE
jgi:hypothetical protein